MMCRPSMWNWLNFEQISFLHGPFMMDRKIKSIIYRIKRRVKRVLFIWACRGPMSFMGKFILKKYSWQPIQIYSVANIEKKSVILAKTASSTVAAPGFNGKGSVIRSKTFPSVKAYFLQRGSIVTPYSPAVLCANELYLPSHVFDDPKRVKTDGDSLFDIEDKFCVGRVNVTKEIEEGILIGGAGAFNWYHFVIEILPKAFLAQNLPSQFDGLPLLVPDECRRIPSFATALAFFSGNRQLEFIKKGEVTKVKRLVILDEISVGPFNLRHGAWPCLDDYAHHDVVMRLFIAVFRKKVLGIEACCDASTGSGRRIFLTRPGVRRKFNQNELLEIAKRYDFEAFSPEEFTLSEQAIVFSQCSAVIGPSGAAWVGIVFRERPLRDLTWLPPEYKQFCGYSALAGLLGHQLDFIEAKTPRWLRSTREAYVSDYQICPVQFESALKRMELRQTF